MLNYTQEDALGNFVTVLARRQGSFKEDVWKVFSDFHPHKDFSISGYEYMEALDSIPEEEKDSLIMKAVSSLKFNHSNQRENFALFAHLKLCSATGYVFMNLIVNILDKFAEYPQFLTVGDEPKVPFAWVHTKEEEGYDNASFFFSRERMNEKVSFFLYDDEILMSIDKNLLQKEYSFVEYPDNATLGMIASDLIERDKIREIHCPWIHSQINYITARNDRGFNKIDFTIGRFNYYNNQNLYY